MIVKQLWRRVKFRDVPKLQSCVQRRRDQQILTHTYPTNRILMSSKLIDDGPSVEREDQNLIILCSSEQHVVLFKQPHAVYPFVCNEEGSFLAVGPIRALQEELD